MEDFKHHVDLVCRYLLYYKINEENVELLYKNDLLHVDMNNMYITFLF